MPPKCGYGRNAWARVARRWKVEYGAVKPLAATAGEEIGCVSRLKSLALVTSKPYFFKSTDGVSSLVVFVSPSELSQTPRLLMYENLTDRLFTISRSMPKVVCWKRGGRPLLGNMNGRGE